MVARANAANADEGNADDEDDEEKDEEDDDEDKAKGEVAWENESVNGRPDAINTST